MKQEILHDLINKYESNIDMLNGPEHNELFKWKAVKCWRDEWFKPADAFDSFAERFNAARKDFLLFIDNSRMHPGSGVIKLWEKEPEKVEYLFNDVLFAETGDDINAVQNNMDRFVNEYNALLLENFPARWSYKQDRHTASVFLVMNDPKLNYVYKSSDAALMADYIDFQEKIGSGNAFNLKTYYKMCEEIVDALKQHDSLLEKHFALLTEEHYKDDSLHLLAFDLMYCCRAYNFYKGIERPKKKKPVKKAKGPSPEEIEMRQLELQKRIDALEDEKAELDHIRQSAEDISLVGIKVESQEYGPGTVISQSEKDANLIKVQFDSCEKTFRIHRKYSKRPKFENDEETVAIFTEYADACDRIKEIDELLEKLRQ